MNIPTDRTAVYVHTSDSQLLPALVGIHSLRTTGGLKDEDVRLLRLEGSDLDQRRDGQSYLAGGVKAWDHTHHAAFHLLRRMIPQLMDYQGRALVVDPDVFAVAPVAPLLGSDMAGKAILARYVPDGYLGDGKPYYSTGVMLLDCSKLKHWTWEADVAGIFNLSLDYWHLLQLKNENESIIGVLDEQWNSMDKLSADTGLLHLTRIATQPWSTGLPLPDDIYDPTYVPSLPTRLWKKIAGQPPRLYRAHPEREQERVFFDLLAGCLNQGLLPESFLEAELKAGRLRSDAFEILAASGYSRASRTQRVSRKNLLDEFGIDSGYDHKSRFR
jgi:hypothetical protein